MEASTKTSQKNAASSKTGPGVGKRTPSKSKGSVALSMRHYHTITPRSNKALR